MVAVAWLLYLLATRDALGLVPFDTDEASKRVRVVCTAPVPKAAMRALFKLTGWTAEPYLVEDELWQQALRMYRPAAPAAGHFREAVAVNGDATTGTGRARAAHRVRDQVAHLGLVALDQCEHTVP